MLPFSSPSPSFTPCWPATLDLSYANTDGITRPVIRKHQGPLRVQKHLYEEDPKICQHILLHPPSGIAGGDQLTINVNLQEKAWSLLTTPGAAKWYGSDYPAFQTIHAHVAENAVLEWLPQETIIFNHAHPHIKTKINLKEHARLCYWDIIALGRKESHELFTTGSFQSELSIYLKNSLIWYECQSITGSDPLLSSPLGLNNYSVFATFIMTGTAEKSLLKHCRAIPQTGFFGDITQLPELIIARCLAHQTFTARNWFIDLWKILRPALFKEQAHPPRIWNT